MTPLRFRRLRRGRVEDNRGFGAEFRCALRWQTCVILAGVAAMLAAAMFPVYLALFAGLGT